MSCPYCRWGCETTWFDKCSGEWITDCRLTVQTVDKEQTLHEFTKSWRTAHVLFQYPCSGILLWPRFYRFEAGGYFGLSQRKTSLFKSNNCSQTKIKLENKIPLTIPAGLAPSLTFSIVNKNNVFAILCYIYSSL